MALTGQASSDAVAGPIGFADGAVAGDESAEQCGVVELCRRRFSGDLGRQAGIWRIGS